MLDPVPMCRLDLLVRATDEHAVLETLGALGLVELGPSTAPWQASAPVAAAVRVTALLDRATHLNATVGPLAHDVPLTAAERWSLESAADFLDRVEPRVCELTTTLDSLCRDREGLLQKLAPAAPFVALLRELGMAVECRSIALLLGSLPRSALRRVGRDIGSDVVVLPLGTAAQPRRPIAVLASAGARAAVASALARHGFEQRDVPPLSELDAQRARLRTVEAEIAAATAERSRVVAAIGSRLRDLAAWLRTEQQIGATSATLGRTETTVRLTGWAPKPAATQLTDALNETTAGRLVLALAPPEHDDTSVPVLLAHGAALRPFAPLVTLYGLPRYGEIVPTPFVAVTYLLMFGMMFGDVGHGALLLLAGFLLPRWRRLAQLRDAAPILGWAGVSSMGFGAIYGSLFGCETFKPWALWHDPLEGDPTELMLAAIGLGVAVLSLGLSLNVLNHLRRRDRWTALTAPLGVLGLAFYWGALALAATGNASTPFIAALGVPLAGWWLRGLVAHQRSHPGRAWSSGLGSAAAEAAVELFETVLGFLANTISFVRLAAYAMSHAALVMVLGSLRAALAPIPVVGTLLAWLVFAAGHALVMVLEATIAAVQALRLEHYEFFGKFFSGNGRPFTPFRLAKRGEVSS